MGYTPEQWSAHQQARLEAALAENAELRIRMDELARTRQVVFLPAAQASDLVRCIECHCVTSAGLVCACKLQHLFRLRELARQKAVAFRLEYWEGEDRWNGEVMSQVPGEEKSWRKFSGLADGLVGEMITWLEGL